MAREEKFYIDAENLEQIIRNLPCLLAYSTYGTGYYTGSPTIDGLIDDKLNSMSASIANSMREYHNSLVSQIADAIASSKRPYTQCMLCNDHGLNPVK